MNQLVEIGFEEAKRTNLYCPNGINVDKIKNSLGYLKSTLPTAILILDISVEKQIPKFFIDPKECLCAYVCVSVYLKLFCFTYRE